MGYAGQPMLVVKANRALLRKRNTFKQVKEMYLDTVVSKTELEFKQVSAEELATIKTKIRKEAKIAVELELTIYEICFIAIALLAAFLFIQMS